jgi:starch phosphorylase
VIAGKAHPGDADGKALIKEWIQFIRLPETRAHAVFLSDYDMHLTEHLVQGVDVWINTPRRPWEACGTSGMKVLVNGGINLSILDGWWAEAYQPELGWALGDGQEHGDDPTLDAVEAAQLYDLLEREVVPEFYMRGEDGIPHAWIRRMRNSMAQLTPRFSTNRSLHEYTTKYYLPCAATYRERAADQGAAGNRIVKWQNALKQNWSALRFGEVAITTDHGRHIFEVQIFLSDLTPDALQVEIYADESCAGPCVRQTMPCMDQRTPGGSWAYRAGVPANRSASEYTVRAIPRNPGVTVPLEASHILWQR